MAGEEDNTMTEQQPTYDADFVKDMQEFQQEQVYNQQEMSEDQSEDQFLQNQELMSAYPAPEPEERMNAHTFLHKAAFGEVDTTKTTFLSESELGRPLFSVRFMLKMEDVAKYYLDSLIREFGLKPEEYNKIANYFKADVQNTTDSGMSNKGFSMNLNVTRRMDATRRRVKVKSDNLKGGKKEESE